MNRSTYKVNIDSSNTTVINDINIKLISILNQLENEENINQPISYFKDKEEEIKDLTVNLKNHTEKLNY